MKKMKKMKIDLSSPLGNAFYLLADAKECAELLDLDWESIHTEMISGDYDYLVNTYIKYFGHYRVLLNKDNT